MKKLLFLMVACVGITSAQPYVVHRSSYISGGTQTGCIANTNSAPVYLDKIIVATATSGGNIMIHNSSWTLSSPIISSATLATVQMYDFNDSQLQGICYRAATPTNGLTIIYHK